MEHYHECIVKNKEIQPAQLACAHTSALNQCLACAGQPLFPRLYITHMYIILSCHSRHAHANVAESPAAVLRLVGEVGWPARASKILFEHQIALSRSGVRLWYSYQVRQALLNERMIEESGWWCLCLMMRLPALDLVSDAVSHGAVIDMSIHESISMYDMILDRSGPSL